MRLFKHGDVLAITVPESLRKKLKLKEGDDYAFVELSDGVLGLVARSLAEKAKPKKAEGADYLILNNEAEARQLSKGIAEKIKRGEVVGVRGFDKRFYVVSRRFLEKTGEAVKKAAGNGADLKAVSTRARLPAEACLAVLSVLKEEGEIFEKKDGFYAAV
jgi:bifunctional DNA-binding transcriptional regulator/antitoxin component of YhaV-PrlF toxin-antitoxin module